MGDRWYRLAAAAVAGVLTVDGLLHVYWSTGRTWPAADARSLSDAVLGVQAPFTPPVVLPLATLLFAAASVVYLRARLGRDHRLGRCLQAGTVAVAAGLLVRGAVGLIWVTGTGVPGSTPFYWLNLLLYTPVCVAGAATTVTLARRGH